MTLYHTILADPPWQQPMAGAYARRRHSRPAALPYPTMTIPELCALPVNDLAADGCHLWLWTTNAFLEQAFSVMRAWGFTYLSPITWVKPSGLGNYFVSRTQHILFGYKDHCHFPLARYLPNVFFASVKGGHSSKPEEQYDLIESISPPERLELFARTHHLGWDVYGNQVNSNVDLALC